MRAPNSSPPITVAGAGFIALDILLDAHQDWQLCRRAGGTCGNVLAILSFLGFNSVPIARLGTDEAADIIVSDLQSVGVDWRHVYRDQIAKTPRVVEYLPDGHGNPHRFGFTCPLCQRRFPRRTEPLFERGHKTVHKVNPSFFFFDRTGPTIVKLALEARKKGALVMFEPYALTNSPGFNKALRVSDIVKYSACGTGQSIEPWLHDLDTCPWLIIETLERGGLNYMIRQRGRREPTWKHQEPFSVNNAIDEAGAGDWCTAGFVSRILRNRPNSRRKERTIRRALAFGQAIAAASILFEGARGYSEKTSSVSLLQAARSTIRRGQLPNWICNNKEMPTYRLESASHDGVCALCLVPDED